VNRTLSAADLAQVLGIGERRVRELAGEGIVTKTARGRYVLAASVQGYMAYRLSAAEGGELGAARAAKMSAEARLKEHELARTQGEYVPIADVEEMLRAPLEAIDVALRTAKRSHGPALAKRLKLSAAEGMAIVESVTEAARADCRRAIVDLAERMRDA